MLYHCSQKCEFSLTGQKVVCSLLWSQETLWDFLWNSHRYSLAVCMYNAAPVSALYFLLLSVYTTRLLSVPYIFLFCLFVWLSSCLCTIFSCTVCLYDWAPVSALYFLLLSVCMTELLSLHYIFLCCLFVWLSSCLCTVFSFTVCLYDSSCLCTIFSFTVCLYDPTRVTVL